MAKRDEPIAVADITATAKKAAKRAPTYNPTRSITTSIKRGAKARDSIHGSSAANKGVVKSLSNAVTNLEKTTKSLTVQTTNLFRQASTNLSKVATESITATKETAQVVGQKLTEDININKQNAIAASMFNINPILGYFAGQVASPEVMNKLKEVGSRGYNKLKEGVSGAAAAGAEKIKDKTTQIKNKIHKPKQLKNKIKKSNQAKISPETKKIIKKETPKQASKISIDKKVNKGVLAAKKKIATPADKARKAVKKAAAVAIDKRGDIQVGGQSVAYLQQIAENTKNLVQLSENLPNRLRSKKGASGNLLTLVEKDENGNEIISQGKPSDLAKLNRLKLSDFKTKWTPTLKNFIKDFSRSRSLHMLKVDEQKTFKSAFSLDEKDKKSVIKSFMHAFKVATDSYEVPIQEKMLRTLIDMRDALASGRDLWPVIRDRLILDNKLIRRTLVTFNVLSYPYRKAIQAFRWATKSRGGYQARLPKKMGSLEHAAKVLDMIYVDGMWRLDNIVHQLKKLIILITNLNQASGARGADLGPEDADRHTWSIWGKISGLFRKRGGGRKVSPKSKYINEDLKRKFRNIHSTLKPGDYSKASTDMANRAQSDWSRAELSPIERKLREEREKTALTLAKWKFKKLKEREKVRLQTEKARLRVEIIRERAKRRELKLIHLKQKFRQTKKSIKEGWQDLPGTEKIDAWFAAKRDKYLTPRMETLKSWGKDKYAKTKVKAKDSYEKAKTGSLSVLIGIKDQAISMHKRMRENQAWYKKMSDNLGFLKKHAKSFGGKLWKMIMFIGPIIGGIFRKMFGPLLGGITKTMSSLLGMPMRQLAMGGLGSGAMQALGIGSAGLMMGGADAVSGVFKAKKWKTTKTAAGVGGFLGGTGEAFTAGGALKGVAKGASIGGMIGSIVPGVGTAIGAGIGAIVGGLLGLIGGKNIAKVLDIALKPLGALVKGIWKLIKLPFTIIWGVIQGIKKLFKTFKEKGIIGVIKELGSMVFNAMKGIVKNIIMKPFSWVVDWFSNKKEEKEGGKKTVKEIAKKESQKKKKGRGWLQTFLFGKGEPEKKKKSFSFSMSGFGGELTVSEDELQEIINELKAKKKIPADLTIDKLKDIKYKKYLGVIKDEFKTRFSYYSQLAGKKFEQFKQSDVYKQGKEKFDKIRKSKTFQEWSGRFKDAKKKATEFKAGASTKIKGVRDLVQNLESQGKSKKEIAEILANKSLEKMKEGSQQFMETAKRAFKKYTDVDHQKMTAKIIQWEAQGKPLTPLMKAYKLKYLSEEYMKDKYHGSKAEKLVKQFQVKKAEYEKNMTSQIIEREAQGKELTPLMKAFKLKQMKSERENLKKNVMEKVDRVKTKANQLAGLAGSALQNLSDKSWELIKKGVYVGHFPSINKMLEQKGFDKKQRLKIMYGAEDIVDRISGMGKEYGLSDQMKLLVGPGVLQDYFSKNADIPIADPSIFRKVLAQNIKERQEGIGVGTAGVLAKRGQLLKGAASREFKEGLDKAKSTAASYKKTIDEKASDLLQKGKAALGEYQKPIADATEVAKIETQKKINEIKGAASESAKMVEKGIGKYSRETREALKNMGHNLNNTMTNITNTIVNNAVSNNSQNNGSDESKKSSYDPYIDDIIGCNVA